MHKLYRLTAIPHFCDDDGNAFGEIAHPLISWKGFFSEKRIAAIEERFETERIEDKHPYSKLECDAISPRNVAEKLAQYFLSKGEYKTENDNTIQEHLEDYYEMCDNSRRYISEFLESHTDAMAPPPFEHHSGKYDPDLEIDSDFVEEVLDSFNTLIRNAYEPYTSLGQFIDESEEELESWEKVFIEDGMLVTRDKLVNNDSFDLREGVDGENRKHVFFTFNDFLNEYSDIVEEADLDSFISEYKDEVRWRKELGYQIEEPAQFLKRWFSQYTTMEFSNFPEDWQDAINDAHAIAAA